MKIFGFNVIITRDRPATMDDVKGLVIRAGGDFDKLMKDAMEAISADLASAQVQMKDCDQQATQANNDCEEVIRKARTTRDAALKKIGESRTVAYNLKASAEALKGSVGRLNRRY